MRLVDVGVVALRVRRAGPPAHAVPGAGPLERAARAELDVLALARGGGRRARGRGGHVVPGHAGGAARARGVRGAELAEGRDALEGGAGAEGGGGFLVGVRMGMGMDVGGGVLVGRVLCEEYGHAALRLAFVLEPDGDGLDLPEGV